MKTVEVKLSNRNYVIRIGTGLIEQAGEILTQTGLSGKAVIITDTTVGGIYGNRLQEGLKSGGFKSTILEVPAGEEQKSLETAGRLYKELANQYIDRTTPVLALGGGVIGDLAGFVAATYMRGVPLVQIPTTFLAQGDSSIGGKVAVNHESLKNIIGTFYHPRHTISDLNTLRTLNSREVIDGLSEIIKHSIILDNDLFTYLEQHIDNIMTFDMDVLETIISRSAQIKANVVEKDELDLGIRNILNYGHTVGHAVESVSKMKVWHGEAVAIGMIAEARISNKLNILYDVDLIRLKNLIVKMGLPVSVPYLDPEVLMSTMQHDKKTAYGKLKMALPKSIGEAVIVDNVDPELVKEVLNIDEES
jgi:3-dehydroquinate synthase